jgi:hypothetical protein
VRIRRFGLDNLTPIIWLKVANIQMDLHADSRSRVALPAPGAPVCPVRARDAWLLRVRVCPPAA